MEIKCNSNFNVHKLSVNRIQAMPNYYALTRAVFVLQWQNLNVPQS